MSSVSLWETLETFIRFKDGDAKTGTAVDAGNFLVSRRISRQRQIDSSWVVNYSSFP